MLYLCKFYFCILKYALYSLIFSPLWMENSTKSFTTINPAITKNTECSIVSLNYWFKVGVSFDHGALLRFASLLAVRTCWTMFQAKNNVKSTPACSALSLVYYQSHKACTANRYLHTKGERNGVQRKTKIIFSRTMMWALELLGLAKRHISRRSNVKQWRHQSCS